MDRSLVFILSLIEGKLLFNTYFCFLQLLVKLINKYFILLKLYFSKFEIFITIINIISFYYLKVLEYLNF